MVRTLHKEWQKEEGGKEGVSKGGREGGGRKEGKKLETYGHSSAKQTHEGKE